MANPPAPAQLPVYYSGAQIAACAVLGGWAQADLQTAVAVAMAESSGQANAVGVLVSGSRAYGLWQIMYPMHGELFPGGITSGWWIDGTTNAKMALSIFRSQGWRAWETYTNARYRLYTAQAAAAVAQISSANIGNSAASVLGSSQGRITAAQQSWAAATGGQAGNVVSAGSIVQQGGGIPDVTGGEYGGPFTTPPVGEPEGGGGAGGSDPGPTVAPSVSPLVRVLEVVLGAGLLLLGAYKLTQPVTQPVTSGVKTAADNATKAAAVVAPEATAARAGARSARTSAARARGRASVTPPKPPKKTAAKKTAAKKTTAAKPKES
jgi:hypothetical protein